MKPESVLVPLLDAIWENEARNETDYDQILTREVKTNRENAAWACFLGLLLGALLGIELGALFGRAIGVFS